MKTKLNFPVGFALACLLSTFNFQLSTCSAATTIDSANRYAYGANVGWMDWRGDTNNGAVIGDYVCSGYIYSANVGWINLGNGSPTNNIRYQNLSSGDFGVTNDGVGNLRGYAYGANIGWINFESTGAPAVDLYTGKLSGYVWSANCGWISLSNATAYVQTTSIAPGALSTNGLPVAWLLTYFGTTNVDANADPDHDGMSNSQEYLAGTNPTNGNDYLRITSITHNPLPSTYVILQWTSQPSRFYAIQHNSVVDGSSPWADYTVFSYPGTEAAGFNDSNTNDFYRIRVFRQLTP
jgi:hypothetical protein